MQTLGIWVIAFCALVSVAPEIATYIILIENAGY